MPQPPLSPDQLVALIQHIIALIGGWVWMHMLTTIFILAAFGIMSLLPEFITVSAVLIGISVLVYLFGH